MVGEAKVAFILSLYRQAYIYIYSDIDAEEVGDTVALFDFGGWRYIVHAPESCTITSDLMMQNLLKHV